MALPWLESAGLAKSTATPQRMVAINIPLGFLASKFFPEDVGRDYRLSPYLEPAAELRDQFTVLSGVSHPSVDGGHATEKSFLTAAPHPNTLSFKNSISLDQYVAGKIGDQTSHASLTLGDLGLSWSESGVAIPSEESPARTFARLFLAGKESEIAQQRRRLQDGQSIMDTVLQEAHVLQSRVSRLDREKLDQYFTSVRETERRLVKSEKWIDTPKPTVQAESPGRLASEDLVGRLATFMDVIALALETDSTRVVALGGNGGSLTPPIKGVDRGYHTLSHHGKDPAMLQQLALIEFQTMVAWANFLKRLKATPDHGGTLLDNTQVLFGSNLGNANGHLTDNLPIVLAGGPFRHGSHLAFDPKNNYPLPNLFVSMLQGLGLEEDRFASGTSTLRGLEMRA